MKIPNDTARFSSALEFAPLPTAVSCARLHTAAVLTEQGAPASLIADAQVIVSELVTNAVDASAALPERPPVCLTLAVTGVAVTVEVWDRSPLDPEVQEPGEGDECGRGLTLVAAFSRGGGSSAPGTSARSSGPNLPGERETTRRTGEARR